jgi:hypothetical protein
MWRLLVVVSLVAGLLGACDGQSSPTGSPSTEPPPADPSPTSSASAIPCPDPEYNPENECLGEIDAGTYTTVQLDPSLTYTVPEAGWANYEDLPGQFLLLPPGADVLGVDPGTSDYIGVYASAAAPRQDCSGRPDRSVPRTVDGYVAWLQANPALDVSRPAPLTVGSHAGVTIDVSLHPGEGPCTDPAVGRFAEFAVGVSPADFSAAVIRFLDYRVDVFEVRHELFLILIGDPHGRGSDEPHWLSTADEVVDGFTF